MDLLKDKVAVVTGAGRGIGRAVALDLARRGASVVVNDAGVNIDGEGSDPACAAAVADEIVALGGRAIASAASVVEAETASALVDLADSHFGALDIWINCAGLGQDTPLHRLSELQWRRALDAQLTGSFFGLRAAAEKMKQARTAGAIVNTTGIAGLRGGFGQAHAAAAAAGVVGLTLTASAELQKYSIRVNAVAPFAKTRLTEALPLFAHVESMRPEHVAPAYVFLASDLSRDVTGAVVGAAGGKLSAFRVSESLGVLKEDEAGVWLPEEIGEHWHSIARL